MWTEELGGLWSSHCVQNMPGLAEPVWMAPLAETAPALVPLRAWHHLAPHPGAWESRLLPGQQGGS